MIFEFDSNKSRQNKIKHGIDFVEAQELWKDPDYLEVSAKSIDEVRKAVIGKIKNKVWVGFITYRLDKIRLISVRRARPEEVGLYES